MNRSNKTGAYLIGKKIYITDKEHINYNEWAIIKDYDGEYYYVGIANDNNSLIILDRDQFKVSKNNSMK